VSVQITGLEWRWVSSLQSNCSSVQTKVTCLLSYTASHYRQSAHHSLVFHAWPALNRCLYTVRHLKNVTVIVICAEQYRPQYGKPGCRRRIAPAQCYSHSRYNNQPHDITAKCLTSDTSRMFTQHGGPGALRQAKWHVVL